MANRRLIGKLTNVWRARQMQAELRGCFENHRIRVDRVIRDREISTVLGGTFDGVRAVFKKYHTQDATRIVDTACTELRFLGDNLVRPFFANNCLATAPESGWIVLGHVPGIRLSIALREAPPDERSAILSLVGQWLGACIRLRSTNRKLGTSRAARLFDPLNPALLEPDDQQIIDTLIGALKRRLHDLEGHRMVHTIAHGDFAPVNLHYDNGDVHAVDIQGGHWFPALRIAARFLVAKDLTGETPATGLCLGLNHCEVSLFLDAAGLGGMLDTDEFRYFVGEQFVRLYVNSYSRIPGNPAMRARLSNLVATLEDAP